MSLMIKGVMQEEWLESETVEGEFVRKDSQFRHWITPDGSAGPSGVGGFKAEADRYHLYVSLACPWAQRTLIFRNLKKLEDLITVSVVHPFMTGPGWSFDDYPGATGDTLYGEDFMYKLYARAQSDYSGIITVPVLWDKKQETIVNNESSEIIRMFNSAFNEITGDTQDFYPNALRKEIEKINKPIYDNLNNGVYRCGFATTQQAYDEAVIKLFDTLDMLEARLSKQRYLVGSHLTEADWRLFPTLVRFDPVYATHFKCNIRRLHDYHHLPNYLRDLYQTPGIAETVNLDHIKRHYYTSHESINPHRIIARGFEVDYSLPHDREDLN